ncbi:hypothetical protein PRIPAC_85665 [Pristionchus pacificus]|uniref:Uncharacterized protein n=1 Tax=Pristionchus pacificus TaxID=54126 RepID=A0A2A6BUJ7_PRIPA|nr:hypothetical protein PRIPAC_85665 [Pristionchus pacificus]|eukprot:PDM69431.1 hypothetical protein PRIPAC_44527 [Pristionchus pacificus]
MFQPYIFLLLIFLGYADADKEAAPIPSIMYEPVQKENNEIKFYVDSNSSYIPYVDRLREVMKREIESNAERERLDKCERRKTDDDFDSDWPANKTDKFCNQKEKDALPMIATVNTTDNAMMRDNTCNYMHSLVVFVPFSLITASSSAISWFTIELRRVYSLIKVVGFFPMTDEELETGIRPTKRDNACNAGPLIMKFNCTVIKSVHRFKLFVMHQAG